MSEPLSVLTWNVNSIRQRLDQVLAWIVDHEPDVACLQETKVEDRLFPRVPFLELGYQVAVHGSKGQAGVATLTRGAADQVVAGFREGEPDRHCRKLSLTFRGVRVHNVYVPNGTELASAAFEFKLAWLGRLRSELDRHEDPRADLVLVGDFNVAPDDRDVWDPASMRGHIHFTDAEHRALADVLGFGLVDCFRRSCDEPGHYTWFDYRTGGFQRDRGMRIDHVYATASLASRCSGVVHDATPRGWDNPSDHLPVLARFGA